MEGLITGVFAEFLRADRARLNAQFAEAQRARPNLDPGAFKEILRDTVAPIVEAIDQRAPATTRVVAASLYDLALDLLAQDFLGAQSRYPSIAQAWNDLLPQIPQHVSAAPRVVIGAITNAIYNLSQVPGARPQEWIATMRALALLAKDPQTFLQAGQIAAWRAGLAHYRAGAIDLCEKIPPPLARVALGLDAARESPSVEMITRQLRADPWLLPNAITDPPREKRAIKVVARVGAFRGLGGLFQTPPRVSGAGDHFVVQDGDSTWWLIADCFGATFHRADGAHSARDLNPFDLDRRGRVTFGKISHTFPELDGWISAASTPTTLAVTTDLSFAVFLITSTNDA